MGIYLNMQQFLFEADSGDLTKYLEQEVLRELGKGFADIAFLPLPHTGRPALLVELKYDKIVKQPYSR